MTALMIAEELLLLAYTEDKGTPLIGFDALDPALGGAVLAELTVYGRVALSKNRVEVTDTTPVGDEELDRAITRIAGGIKRKPVDWMSALGGDQLRKRLLTRLVARGALSKESARVLKVFPTTRWPEADGTIETSIRERVTRVLDGERPDERTAALIAVVHACKLDREVFPEASKRRVEEIVKGDWAGEAVTKAIASLHSAITGAAFLTVT